MASRSGRPTRQDERPITGGRRRHLPGPPGDVARLLGPLLLPERLARLEGVLARRTRHLTVLLQHVHDPHNVAACLRSTDGMGLQELHVIPPEGVAPAEYAASRKVAIGSERWLTVHHHRRTRDAVSSLRERGYRLAVTVIDGDERLERIPVDRPLCVAFGNERDGATDALRAAADHRIGIPMLGFSESLNISVACALTLYTLRTRADRELSPDVLALPREELLSLLDAWIYADVPRARHVLAELRRRASLPAGGSTD